MNNSLKQRLLILVAVLFTSIVFIYPTLNLVIKKSSGKKLTNEDMKQKGLFSKPLQLGLDLSGGVHLVYQVVTEEALSARLQNEVQSIRGSLRKEKIPVTKVNVTKDDNLEITLFSNRKLEEAKTLIKSDREHLKFEKKDDIGSRVKLTYSVSEPYKANIKKSSVIQAIETLRNRVDQFGVSEPLIQQVGESRILLQMPGVKDVETVKKIIGKVARLEFRLLPGSNTSSADTVLVKSRDNNSDVRVEREVRLTGSAVDDARVSFDQNNQVEVSLTFNSEGGRTFASLTSENVGRNLAIILDGQLYSAPVIRERIGGGRCSISGNFTVKEARELAVVLKAGALPAPLKILEEKTVGPSLGAESIRKGIIAIVIGFLLIVIFMVVYYKKSGALAVVILALNIFLMCAALSAVGATLTLPGLAGLALTVGMAVDANVIIFERIREELRNGAGRDASVHSGFEKALSAILDSNVTTLLSALILVSLGTGSIRGFGFTLAVGIVTTIFCATFVARVGFDYFELKSKNKLSI